MDWGTLIQILVIVSGSGWLGIVIKAFFDRRKTNVDTGATLSNAALAQVTAADAREQKNERRLNDMEEDVLRLRVALRNHDRWDRMVVKKLLEAEIEVEDPPEIWVL
jgi:hypothetical protein